MRTVCAHAVHVRCPFGALPSLSQASLCCLPHFPGVSEGTIEGPRGLGVFFISFWFTLGTVVIKSMMHGAARSICFETPSFPWTLSFCSSKRVNCSSFLHSKPLINLWETIFSLDALTGVTCTAVHKPQNGSTFERPPWF